MASPTEKEPQTIARPGGPISFFLSQKMLDSRAKTRLEVISLPEYTTQNCPAGHDTKSGLTLD
eukprot:scaffold322502_cov17-Prasinocladus_malaysianus.AAC.1